LCNENIILYGNNKLRIFDLKGNERYKEKINAGLYVDLGQEGITIYDRDSSKLYKLNEEIDKLWSLDFDKNISSIFSNDGYTFVLSKSGDENKISVITPEGKILKELSSEKFNYINGYIHNNSIVSTGIDISKGILEGIILSYDTDGELLWSKSYKDQIIQKVDFLNKNIVVITDGVISNIKNEKLLWSKELKDTLVDSLVYKNHIYVLSDKTLSSIDNTGRLNFKKNIEEDYLDLDIKNDKLYLIGKNNIKILDTKGDLINNYVSNDIKKALITEENIVLLKEEELVIGKLNR